jgi:Holliday junction resolvasome RuvABC DNA-binding subunit
MTKAMKELQKLKGVGAVLARRIAEAGYDTFAKVAAAGEEGLRKIPGINPRLLKSIVTQAEEMAGEAEKSTVKKVEELKQQATSLKERVQEIALGVRDRFKNEVVGTVGKKVEKEISKVITSLEKVEVIMERRVKKAGKGLAKAEKRMEALADAGLKGVGKGLKKARKSLKRVFAK